jgi:hypothetical protein
MTNEEEIIEILHDYFRTTYNELGKSNDWRDKYDEFKCNDLTEKLRVIDLHYADELARTVL